MRLRLLVLVLPVFAFACADSHGTDDAGPDAASDAPRDTSTDAGPPTCNDDGPRPQCARDCLSDVLIPPVCVGTEWRCPLGAIDPASCCMGDPGPGCFCDGNTWVCDGCPAGIDPRDPDAPGSACFTEGATCSEGSQCGFAMFCTCESGAWNCGVTEEPDAVCYCGREPTVGDGCTGEVEECGQCCPTLEGPNWAPMACVDGAWQAASCPEVVCPELLLECPVEIEGLLGTECVHEDQSCGDPCCGSVRCMDGVWREGPLLGCACAPSPECGTGTCTENQSCNQRCGPDDGIEHRCVALPSGCADCDCMPTEPGQRCEMVDGQVRVLEDNFCG